MLDLFSFILHVDQHLLEFIQDYGLWIYAILFLIVFVETGVVVMPFLPGDSLLFAAGMLAAHSPELNIVYLIVLLLTAAILGDSLNYAIGRRFGQQVTRLRLFNRQLVKPEHIEKTHQFFEKYGSKTIVIARFVPIIRTLAPFVAGIGSMRYSTFLSFNVIGAFLWVVGISLAGYFLGNIPVVKENFSLVVMGIVVVSILPMVFAMIKSRLANKLDN